MVKASLIIIGILILLGTFIITEVYLTSDAKSDIRTANSLCTAEVNVLGFKVPIGSWGQKILGAQEDCQRVHYYMFLIDYGFIGYIIGSFLLFLGLILGWTVSSHEEKAYRHNSKHCGECGSKLEGHEKHCSDCGAKI